MGNEHVENLQSMADFLTAKKRDGSVDDAVLATAMIRDIRAAADYIEELERVRDKWKDISVKYARYEQEADDRIEELESRPAVPQAVRELEGKA